MRRNGDPARQGTSLPILFVIIVAVVAGLVAAGGDRMGYRAARRKLRIGKLRPRTVAMLIAVMTGVLISLATYAVVLLLWADFREALFRYDEVKANMGKAEAEARAAEQAAVVAEQRLIVVEQQKVEAQKEKSVAQEELIAIQKEASDLRGVVAGMVIERDKLNREVSSGKKQVGQLKGQISTLADEKENLEGYEAVEGDLRDLLEQATESFETGEIVLARGTVIFYQRVSAAEHGNMETVMNRVINRALVSLERGGLKLDPNTEESAQQFAAAYPYKGSSEDSVITVRAGKNIIKGQNVELEFTADSLKFPIKSGSTIMTIRINGGSASIEMLDGSLTTVAVPEAFDSGSAINFIGEVKRLFGNGLSSLGFLPIPRSGGYNMPEADINSLSEILLSTPRPLTIRLIASQDYSAIDGVRDLTVESAGGSQ